MMNKLLKGACAASGALLLTACGDTFDPSGDRVGRILPTVGLDTQVSAPASQSDKAPSRADEGADAVNVSDLSLRLTASDGGFSQTYADAADLYGQDVPVGGYTLEAFYGTDGDEGYGRPYYYGSQTLTVLENKSTPVSVTASLANAIVSVRYSEAVLKYFTSCSASVRTASGADFAVDPQQTSLLYVTPGKVDINVDVVRPTGAAATLNPYSFTAEARHHYYVTFDINNGAGAGDAFLKVTFNASTVDEEIEINVSDQVLVSPAPTVTLTGVEGDLDFIEGTSPADKMRATVVAQGGLKTVRLTTQSPSLIAQGWPADVDFASADPSVLATLRNLGLSFPGLEGTKTQMALLDFTDVIRNVSYVEGADNTTTFTIVAQDNLTKLSEPASFSFTTSRLELSLGDIEPLYFDDTELALVVNYNGSDFKNDVKFTYYNELGVWAPLTVKSVTPLSRATSSAYKVVLAVAADGNLRLRAEYGTKVTDPVDVVRTEPIHTFTVSDNDAFATYAVGTLVMLDGSDAAAAMSSAHLLLSTDGAKYEEVTKIVTGSSFRLTGLTPSTTYYLKGTVNGLMCRPVTFTTEAALQLPNANMDGETTVDGSGSHWENIVFPAPWGTNNAMTTSQGGDFAYVRNSGTITTTDAHSGSAALIRTVGWGSGNSAAGAISKVKYVDAGMLHLGANRTVRNGGALSTDDIDHGYAFASRPSSISFWYKYSPKNGNDKGLAEVWVKDASGNVLSSRTLDLSSTGEYTQVTMDLNYDAGASKAASIYVKLLSTNNTDYLSKSNLSLGSVLPSAQHLGSQLYIDDITLNY